ncbi:MAG: class I adenylate-forming enzyme family protein [Halodesulfurarchaeum sp.]
MSRDTTTTANTPWELFRRTALSTPDKEAVVDTRRDERFTYRELYEQVCGLVGALRERGVGQGDTYATVLKNGVEQTSAIVAPSAVGAVANTVNYRQSPDAITHILTDSETRVVIFDEANREVIAGIRDDLDTVEAFLYVGDEPPSWADDYDDAVGQRRGATTPSPALGPSDPVYLVYTSGTTGAPKGCLYTNHRLVETLLHVKAEFRQDDERALLIAPQPHAAGGIGGGTTPVFFGGTVITLPDFHPVRTLERIEQESITYLLAVPAMLQAMMSADPSRFDTGTLEILVSFGSSLSADLAHRVTEVFDPDYVGNHMGATEIAWYLTRDVTDDLDAAASPGTAAINVETRVVKLDENGEAGGPDDRCESGETGELIVNTPYGMDRYFNRVEATDEAFQDGWYYTGDLGHLDDDGRFQPEGRKTNMIISGGINVSDVNVERILRNHPAVVDVAVVGVPDEKWGERVVASVVRESDSSLTEAELLNWCRERDDLADFQRPKAVEFVDQLPRSATGKVQKFKINKEITS